MVVQEAIQSLVELLKESDVELAVLHGSQVLGTAGPRSDIDVALQCTPHEMERLHDKVRECIPTLRRFDFALLDEVSADLKKEVMEHGRIIYRKDAVI